MISRKMRVQMIIFTVISLVSLVILGVNYLQVPAALGIGKYNVTVKLTDTGGLYPKSIVTYRGAQVGVVTAVDLADGDLVHARLQLDRGHRIPSSATAQIRSASVIGEQYVNFVPREGASERDALSDGDVVPVAETSLPVTTNEVLDSVDGLISSVPQDDLRTLVTESGAAANGVGPSLATLLDDGASLERSATRALPETKSLIVDGEPVLATQQDLAPSLRTFSASLEQLTGSLARNDMTINQLVDRTPAFSDQIGGFSDDLKQTLPPVLADTASVSEPLRAYRKALEHVFILFPAMETALQATVPMEARKSKETRLNLNFDLGFDPPVCTHGFADADKQRSPHDTKPVPIPSDSYCKVASDSGLVARGARNDTCPNDPSRHGARASSCGLIFDDKAIRYPSSFPGNPSSETRVPLLGIGDLVSSLIAGNETSLRTPTRTAHSLSDLLTRPGGRR